ncbi:hypothetical protein KO516_14050 [Citreicella sp. C3M06]|uniref:hypothetical protein n=1 Tax=Citreicella sp. C3M06 TaxID=2841564 RepID=UPI001C0965E2|nr:hypothetical protein [Citreicella sp. C3M06]MBU2961909.1 hypothetical protein [Citreicella sp. C3M06]
MTSRSTSRTALAALLVASLATGAAAQAANNLTAQAQADAAARLEADSPLTPPPETLAELVGSLSGDGVAVPMEDMPEGTQIETLSITELPSDSTGSGNDAALDTALSRAQTQLDMLQTRIDGDTLLTEALEADGVTSDQVLGVYASGSGQVTVLIDDRS